jgi:ArsR family transcriptional regulator
MESKAVVRALSALQETRLAIYRMLVEHGPAGSAAGKIGDPLKLPPATLSFHLRELLHAGLVCAKQQSRFIYYSADFTTMNGLLGYLADHCCRTDGGLYAGGRCAPRSTAYAVRATAHRVVRPKTGRPSQKESRIKRFRVHVAVSDLDPRIGFYSTLRTVTA